MNAENVTDFHIGDPAPAGLSAAASACDGEDFTSELLALTPQLKAYTRILCGRWEDAEDLAQEALFKAWRHRTTFQPRSNLRAWLVTIARNEYYSRHRRERGEASICQAAAENIAICDGGQVWSTELTDTLRALATLPDYLGASLLLVGASGWSHDDVAALCGRPTGTVKSRVCRARRALAALLEEAPASAASPSPDTERNATRPPSGRGA